jgi:DNA-binding MarR family transcriptional regulator
MGDLPVSAYRVVTVLAREEAGLGDLANRLRVSKQAMSRVVELLVQRGYCLRTPDPTDGRRSALVLTDRGRHAAREIVRAFDQFDQDLAAQVDVADVAAARRVLEAAIALSRPPTRR